MTVPSYSEIKRVLETAPILRSLGERLYERRFAGNCMGSFRGVFENFAEARLSAPKTKSVGFNSAECAHQFVDRRSRVFSFDYPVIFWLQRLLQQGGTIFDLGGHVGIQFYAYHKYLKYPAGLNWMVCDLPEITKEGQALAQAQNEQSLSFTNRMEDADGANILIAAGSLQYIESPSLSGLLSKLEHKPHHLLINKVPLYDGDQFVTLQNGGAAFHPQYVFNRQEFIDSLTAIGYHLIDCWDVDTHPGYIPFHPEKSFPCHSGLYLTLGDSPQQW